MPPGGSDDKRGNEIMINTAKKNDQTVESDVNDISSTRYSHIAATRYKFSNISWIKGDLQQCVLRAAVDWKNFQSAENSHALYMAILAMLGEEPENIHLLD
jgi:hypothetical protein